MLVVTAIPAMSFGFEESSYFPPVFCEPSQLFAFLWLKLLPGCKS